MNTDLDLKQTEIEGNVPSCSPKLSRSQFLDRLVKKAVIAGTLAVAPTIADSFIAPPKAAAASGPGSGISGGSSIL